MSDEGKNKYFINWSKLVETALVSVGVSFVLAALYLFGVIYQESYLGYAGIKGTIYSGSLYFYMSLGFGRLIPFLLLLLVIIMLVVFFVALIAFLVASLRKHQANEGEDSQKYYGLTAEKSRPNKSFISMILPVLLFVMLFISFIFSLLLVGFKGMNDAEKYISRYQNAIERQLNSSNDDCVEGHVTVLNSEKIEVLSGLQVAASGEYISIFDPDEKKVFTLSNDDVSLVTCIQGL